MTKEDREAIRDLKRRVREFTKGFEKMAIERIDKLQRAGVDLAGAHEEAEGPYVIPRLFFMALCDEAKFQYGIGVKRSPQRRKMLKNFQTMM